jgi:hypothetical protein
VDRPRRASKGFFAPSRGLRSSRGRNRGWSAGEQVTHELVDALLEPTAAGEQMLGERAHVAQGVGGLLEVASEKEGVCGSLALGFL